LLDLPEKLAPVGTFDILGYSHQIFHVGIIAGVVLEWSYFYSVQIKSQ
jgi:predicted membrane channel-forming protein YqfA (hemolysin III family)